MPELNIKKAEINGIELSKRHHFRYDLSLFQVRKLIDLLSNTRKDFENCLFLAVNKGFHIGFYQGYKAAKRDIERGNQQLLNKNTFNP